jgi:hyperosmotically inducible periplasmic protein
MRNFLLVASVISVLSSLAYAGSAYAGSDSGPVSESRPKEVPAPSPDKRKPDEKKHDSDLKPADTGAKPPSEEKAQKAEEPPSAPKPDESGGKKPGVTSLNLTIKLALMADPSVFPFELEIEMDGQKATVTGTVWSEDEKIRAADIVHKVEGVESVNNNVSVSPALRTAWMKKQDEALASLVKERLNKSETLKAVGFEVKSDNGIVFLSGKTRFQVIALEAAEAARHIPGVRAVNAAAVQITGKE